MTEILSVPHFQQSADGYCLPACARMALAYRGLSFNEAEIGRLLDSKSYGTPAFAIQKLARLNLRVNYREWSAAEALLTLQAGNPIIVFIRTGMLDYWEVDTAHALVLVGAVENDYFWAHDPYFETGPRRVDWNGLLAAWAEFSYRGAVIEAPE